MNIYLGSFPEYLNPSTCIICYWIIKLLKVFVVFLSWIQNNICIPIYVTPKCGMGPHANGVICGAMEWVKRNMLRWFGHTERMGSEDFMKKVSVSKSVGPRHRGRPLGRWRDRVREYTCTNNNCNPSNMMHFETTCYDMWDNLKDMVQSW